MFQIQFDSLHSICDFPENARFYLKIIQGIYITDSMPCRTGNRATPRQKASNQHRLIAPLVGALWMFLKIGFRIKKKINKTTKFAHTAMPEARNPPLNRHGVHLPKQQAPPSPARQSYRTKVPRAGAITPPSQVIRSRPGDVSLPRREGETERQSRGTPRLPKCD